MERDTKHKKLILQFLNGKEIQYYCPILKEWISDTSPAFEEGTTYRIKQIPITFLEYAKKYGMPSTNAIRIMEYCSEPRSDEQISRDLGLHLSSMGKIVKQFPHLLKRITVYDENAKCYGGKRINTILTEQGNTVIQAFKQCNLVIE